MVLFQSDKSCSHCTILFSEAGLHNYSKFTCPLGFWKMCWFSWTAWLMKGNFCSSTLVGFTSTSEVWTKPSFTIKMFLTIMPSYKGISSPRQIMTVSSKSAFTVSMWVPFHFIFLYKHNMQNNRWSSKRMPWKENAFVKGHSRLCWCLVLLDCDHASFVTSILLNLPQVPSPRAVSLERWCPCCAGFTGTECWGAGAVGNGLSFIISHTAQLRQTDDLEPEEKGNLKLSRWAGKYPAASAAG